MRLAVLMTCHNRRVKTTECLRALHACLLPPGVVLEIYLVDDGSRDGTSEAVRQEFPRVRILDGDGNLFWNGGMRRAFAAAMKDGYDGYLWLNDDTILYPSALQTLLDCSRALAGLNGGRQDIVVGATCDPESGVLTYGGLVNRSRLSPRYYVHLPVSDQVQSCKTLNGNCVLVPAEVAKVIGNIDDAFIHAIGDWDYGFRARAAGFGIWMVPGFVGTCSQNPPVVIPRVEAANIRAQLRRICGPKRVPPRAWRTFVQRHYGVLWPAYFIRPYVSTVLRALAAKMGRVT